ncbi:MAG: beta-Ig-H3/fasciclin, partial [Myxococcales bacterium]|nr:beta-Ig-H3/fasciclin [Myxococcales bacterium]
PEGTVEALVEDANNGGDQLAKILKLHVVAAAVMSTDLTDGQVVNTANGDLTVSISGDTVTFSNGNVTATVVTANIEASNGVIHVIDQVLLPAAEAPTEKNIVETAIADGNFETLVAAVQAANLVELLSSEGPFTVLAPTDAAFAALEEGTVERLVMDAQMGGTQLADILSLHVITGGAVMSEDLEDAQVITTENGELTVGINDDGVTFTSANSTATVVGADVPATNGVIHAIDTVLLP